MSSYPLPYRAAVTGRQAAAARFSRTFLIIQAIHILVLVVIGRDTQPALLAASGFMNVILYGLLIKNEAVSQRWVATPILLYCVTSMMRVGFAVIYVAAVYMHGYQAELRIGHFDGVAFVGRGHILILVGDWCLLAGYFAAPRFLNRFHLLPIRALSLPTAAIIMGLGLAAVTWILRIIMHSGVDITSQGMFLLRAAGYCAPAGILILLVASTRGRGAMPLMLKGLAALILLAELGSSLRGYMKQPTITAMAPLAVYFLLRLRTGSQTGRMPWRRVWPLILLLASVVLVLFPFNSQLRQRYHTFGVHSGDVWSLLQGTLYGAIPGTSEFREANAFPSHGVWEFVKRNEFTTLAGWAVSYVESEGTVEGQSLQEGLVAIVPRVFWPEKPAIDTGAEFSRLIGIPSESSTALGLAAALYWNGGYFLVVAGMLANGFVLAITWRLVRAYLFGNPAAVVVYVVLLLESARWFESQFDGGIGFHAYNWIVFIPMILIYQGLLPRRSRQETLDEMAS